MPRVHMLAGALAAAMVAAGCGDQGGDPAGPVPAVAKTRVDLNSRANFVWDDSILVNGAWLAAGIRGDGRLKDGSPAAGTPCNEYHGAWCGVAATLATDGTAPSGDMDFTPGVNYTSSMQTACHGGPRVYNFYLSSDAAHLKPSALASGPHSIARGLANLAPGAAVAQWEGFGIGQANCSILMFNDLFPPSQSLIYTRLPDVAVGGTTVRQWRIESQGSHVAACVHTGSKSGTYVLEGTYYFVPFALTVTEVPYPYSSFP
jgi:hypothetical protein